MNRSPNVLATFRAEAIEKLAAIDDALMSLESPGGVDAEKLDPANLGAQIQIAFRHAHGLKGAAGLLGMPKLVTLLHAMETVFGKMRDEGLTSSSALVDTLLQTTESARQLVHDSDQVSAEKIAGLEEALQFSTRATPHEGPTDASKMSDSSARRVLIVDDSPLSRMIVRDAATAAGWTVIGEAANGREALAIFRDLRPPLVTLDLVMPELGGLDALVEMKALDPEVTVVIISALQQREVFREAFRRGASDFLVKPVDSQRLQAMFHRAESHQATAR